MPTLKDQIQEAEAKLKAIEARKTAREEDQRLAGMLAEIKRKERTEEEDAFQDEVAEALAGKELGVHWDFLRFGDHLVAFAHQRAAHEIFIKKAPEKGQVPAPEVKNFVSRSLVRVDNEAEDPKVRGEMFDAIVNEFPGAPADIANVLLELAKGGVARRAGK